MQITEILILGAIQGLTEFLPVSSSGHLVLARLIFSIADTEGTAVDAFLHLGTLLAVLTYYRHTWLRMIKSITSNGNGLFAYERKLISKLAIATIPAAMIGYAFQAYADTALRSVGVVAAGLLFTAASLLVGDILLRRRPVHEEVSWRSSLIIGLAQVLALVPGVSRSGITIAAGRAEGLSRRAAADFSFLLSAPIIAGAGLSSLAALLQNGALPYSILLAGFGVSFLFGLLAIYLLLRITERFSFLPFVVYVTVVAVLLLIFN